MNAGRQAAWMFILLIGLACSGWYFASTPSIIKLDDKTLSTSIDMIIEDLTIRHFDAQGQLINYLKTPYATHIPLDNTHSLKSPHIIISQADQSSWEIRSQEAVALYGGKEITFKKDVVVHQNQRDQTPSSTLTTQEITYFPKDKFATTRAEVIFQQPGNVIHSKGMNAYLAEKRVQLLSRARGVYDPKHS